MILEVFQGEYLLKIGSLCEGYLRQLGSNPGTSVLQDFRGYLKKLKENDLNFAYDKDRNCQIPTDPFELGWSAEKVRDCCGERPALEAVAVALLYQQKKADAPLSLTSKTLCALECRLFQFHWQLALTLTAQLLVDAVDADVADEAPQAEILQALAELAVPVLRAEKKIPALRELLPHTKSKAAPKGFQKMLGHLSRIFSTASADLLKDAHDNTYTYRTILYDVFFQIKKTEECTSSATADQLPAALLKSQPNQPIETKYITRYSLLAVLWDLLPSDSPTPIQADVLKWHGFKKTTADSALKKTVPDHGENFFVIQTLSDTSVCTLMRKQEMALSPLPDWWCRPGSTAAAYSKAMREALQKQKEEAANKKHRQVCKDAGQNQPQAEAKSGLTCPTSCVIVEP